MLMLPIPTTGHTADALVLVLSDENLERMNKADPFEVDLRRIGVDLVSPRILICYEKDSPEFTRMLQTRDMAKILEYLQRGWKHCPERGDATDPRKLHEGN